MELKKVREFDDSYILLQDSQDCIAAIESTACGMRYEGDSYLAKIGDGEYLELWQIAGFVPYLDTLARRIA